jgi:hypothetical protein
MADGIVAALVLANEAGGIGFIEEVAQFLRHNRSCEAAGARWSDDLPRSFVTATKQFVNQLERRHFREVQTDAACQAFGHLAESLLNQRVIGRNGNERAMTLDDVLVTAPYNMQVNLLRSCLPKGTRVGTAEFATRRKSEFL